MNLVTITNLKEVYALDQISLIGLIVGARGTVTQFHEKC